ncbi:MAG: hypothetical protein QW331_00520 [Candidatus Woesearchaeota archaeon]
MVGEVLIERELEGALPFKIAANKIAANRPEEHHIRCGFTDETSQFLSKRVKTIWDIRRIFEEIKEAAIKDNDLELFDLGYLVNLIGIKNIKWSRLNGNERARLEAYFHRNAGYCLEARFRKLSDKHEALEVGQNACKHLSNAANLYLSVGNFVLSAYQHERTAIILANLFDNATADRNVALARETGTLEATHLARASDFFYREKHFERAFSSALNFSYIALRLFQAASDSTFFDDAKEKCRFVIENSSKEVYIATAKGYLRALS